MSLIYYIVKLDDYKHYSGYGSFVQGIGESKTGEFARYTYETLEEIANHHGKLISSRGLDKDVKFSDICLGFSFEKPLDIALFGLDEIKCDNALPKLYKVTELEFEEQCAFMKIVSNIFNTYKNKHLS